MSGGGCNKEQIYQLNYRVVNNFDLRQNRVDIGVLNE
jgi:hypothetical protein